jgi:hypothetical protein
MPARLFAPPVDEGFDAPEASAGRSARPARYLCRLTALDTQLQPASPLMGPRPIGLIRPRGLDDRRQRLEAVARHLVQSPRSPQPSEAKPKVSEAILIAFPGDIDYNSQAVGQPVG